jgi:cellulose synthase/poly-beta-1,6-N-acetylglucosamine synthase-like glycosyltransferase
MTTARNAAELPFVSVIIPCLNERDYIERCLDSVVASGYPLEKLEVIVVDGMSADGTRDVLRDYAKTHSFFKLVDNPQQIIPKALNLGFRASKGSVILRMDAHTTYAPDYIPQCVEWLLKTGADAVGGVLVTKAAAPTRMAEAIAAGMSSLFGVGDSYFRIGSSVPRYVDTVPFGCYRREILEKAGLFDEHMSRSEDDEFHTRLVQRGGKILLVPQIVSSYYARATLSELAWQYFSYGSFKPRVIRKLKTVATLRQLAPPFLIVAAAGSGVAAFFHPMARDMFFTLLAARRMRWRALRPRRSPRRGAVGGCCRICRSCLRRSTFATVSGSSVDSGTCSSAA